MPNSTNTRPAWKRFFFKTPSSTGVANVGDTTSLSANLRKYVNAYTPLNKNKRRTNLPMNSNLIRALKNYINSQRPGVAGAVAAAVNNAGGSNNNAAKAAAAAAKAANPNASPTAVANATSKALLAIQAPPSQVVAGAAAAAAKQANANGQNPNNAAARAAAAAANAATSPNTPPANVARIAAAGAANAGANQNAQANAAAKAARNQAENQGAKPAEAAEVAEEAANEAVMPESNTTSKSVKILRSYLANHTTNNAVNGQIRMLNRYRANANASGQLNANLRNKVNARLAHLRGLGAAQVQRPNTGINSNETGGNAPLVLNVNVPGTNTKVKVVRKNAGSNWNFANNANKAKYNLNNRNANKPTVRNIGAGNLFKQGN